MENGKTENEAEDKMEDVAEDQDKDVEEANMEIAQLQGLVAELHEGLRGALMELCEVRQRDHGLEERLQAHQSDVDDKIMGLKNSLNTFKEELSVALFHIKDVSSRQREVQKRMELLQTENSKDIISVPHRKSSKGDVLTVPGEGHVCLPSQSELNVIQHYFASLPNSGSPHRSTASTQTSTSEQEAQQQQRGCRSKSPVWGERKNSRDETEAPSSPIENNKRQTAALELLESERVYVSYLSLLLKANISFNGSEALISKDKRPFPSSLRFLIQQHLELLHTLQERVLKYQWQGIMGDVFMKLTSKESDFLDFYVSYLKELPGCLSVVSMLTSSSMKSAALHESDIMGDESKPSLHTLLLQPVQRIPEYLLLLQGLLRQTEAEHPDYYLLLVCIQQFRSFTAQYHHLLQHNQELLQMKRSTMKQMCKTVECGIQANSMGSPYPSSNAMLEHANQVKRSKQRLLEQIQSRRFQDWDRDRDRDTEPHSYDPDRTPQFPLFPPDPDSRNHKPISLRSIPESEASEGSVSCKRHLSSRPPDFHQVQPGSALADALEEFLLPPDPPGMEGLYEEDGDSLHNVSLFDNCSSASSDSSIDIAFVRCPKAPPTSHHAVAVTVSSTREAYSGRGSQGIGYNKLPNRGCVSPDEAVMMRHNQHRPLQASQRKSKSLNGLQLDSTVSGLDGGPLSDHFQRVGMGNHAKLERQSSKGSKGCPTPCRKVQANPVNSQHRVDTDKHNEDLRGLLSKDSGTPPPQSWGEEPKWGGRAEENNHTPLSERSRKQEKGGFRSSFKKLFKKKGGEEKKEKTSENQISDHEIDRGTAV